MWDPEIVLEGVFHSAARTGMGRMAGWANEGLFGETAVPDGMGSSCRTTEIFPDKLSKEAGTSHFRMGIHQQINGYLYKNA